MLWNRTSLSSAQRPYKRRQKYLQTCKNSRLQDSQKTRTKVREPMTTRKKYLQPTETANLLYVSKRQITQQKSRQRKKQAIKKRKSTYI